MPLEDFLGQIAPDVVDRLRRSPARAQQIARLASPRVATGAIFVSDLLDRNKGQRNVEPTALFQQRRSEVIGREPVHNNNHGAARNEALFDDAGIPVAKALLLELRGDLIRLHRVVDDRQFGAEARDGSAHRRRQALPTLRGGQEVLGQLGEHRPGKIRR